MRVSKIPAISHLQFLVLSRLNGPNTRLSQLRTELNEMGVDLGNPGFYQLVDRLVRAGYIKKQRVGREVIASMTREGTEQLAMVQDFYQASTPADSTA